MQRSLSPIEERSERLPNRYLGTHKVAVRLPFDELPCLLEVAVVEASEFDAHFPQEIVAHEHGDETGPVGQEIGRILPGSLAALLCMPEQQGGNDRLSTVQIFPEDPMVQDAKMVSSPEPRLMRSATPDRQDGFGDHGTREFIQRYRLVFALGPVRVSQAANRRVQGLLAWLVGFQIPEIDRVLAVRSKCNCVDEFVVVLSQLVYSDEYFSVLNNVRPDFLGYLLYGPCGLPAIDNLQVIYPQAPVSLLQCIVAKL